MSDTPGGEAIDLSNPPKDADEMLARYRDRDQRKLPAVLQLPDGWSIMVSNHSTVQDIATMVLVGKDRKPDGGAILAGVMAMAAGIIRKFEAHGVRLREWLAPQLRLLFRHDPDLGILGAMLAQGDDEMLPGRMETVDAADPDGAPEVEYPNPSQPAPPAPPAADTPTDFQKFLHDTL